jgi:NitT/TauT family transport system permease protein
MNPGTSVRDSPRTRQARAATWARGLAGVAGFLLLLQAASWLKIISPSLLPPVFTVLARAAALLGNGQFLGDLAATVQAWAVGLAVTIAVAVPAGLVLGSVPLVRSATRALIEFLRPIPSVSLIPLAALLLGAGLRLTVTLIVYAAVWPVLFNTIYGLDDVDPAAKDTLRAFGFGRLDVLRRVSLPSAAPFIATGIRLASSVALILDIGTGILTGRIDGPGIGAFIADANTGANGTPIVLAATVWAGILGISLNALLVWAERRALRWHHAYSVEAR